MHTRSHHATAIPSFEYKNFLDFQCDVILLQSDIIVNSGADCLVNCTGPCFERSSKLIIKIVLKFYLNFISKGGVSKAINQAAGQKNLEKEFRKYLDKYTVLNYETVCVTNSFDLINYKYLLHVASPYSSLPNKETILLNTILGIFNETFIKLDLKSVAMPFIGTGLLTKT
jgi:hypothetical protein